MWIPGDFECMNPPVESIVVINVENLFVSNRL